MDSTTDKEQLEAQKNAGQAHDEDEGKGQTAATSLTTNLVDKMKAKMMQRTTLYTGPFMKVPPTRCGNSCFGMCGSDCKCDKSVCGDCDAHKGCWEHDCYCSCISPNNIRCRNLTNFNIFSVIDL